MPLTDNQKFGIILGGTGAVVALLWWWSTQQQNGGCETSVDCPPGFSCINGKCVENPPCNEGERRCIETGGLAELQECWNGQWTSIMTCGWGCCGDECCQAPPPPPPPAKYPDCNICGTDMESTACLGWREAGFKAVGSKYDRYHLIVYEGAGCTGNIINHCWTPNCGGTCSTTKSGYVKVVIWRCRECEQGKCR